MVLHIKNVKRHCHLPLELLVRAYQLWQFTCKWLQSPKYGDSQPLLTTQDEWTLVKYVMAVLRPFTSWTLWMSKSHLVTLHHISSVYNDSFNHVDGVLHALAKKMTPWMQGLNFAVKLAWQKLFIYQAEITPTTVMLVIWADILDPLCKLRWLRNWAKGMDNNPGDETSYANQYLEEKLKDLKTELCAKRGSVPFNQPESLPSNIPFLSAMA